MRLAYVSPFPPQPSGVSEYSAELVPYLAQGLDLTLVTDGVTVTAPALRALPQMDLRTFAARAREFDAALYHIGNAPLYANFYEMALRVPGLVVLHDLVLHHLRAWQTLERGDRAAYFAALRNAYGEDVAAQAQSNSAALDRFDFPLSEELAQHARGVIVHSEYAANLVRRAAPGVPVAHVPMGVALPPVISKDAARARLNLAADGFIISAFGQVHPHKRITVALEAFAELLPQHPNAQMLLIGSPSPNYDVRAIIASLGLGSAVRAVGYVEWEDYQNYIAASDVCLNLRYPTAGETSASLLRLLAAGRVTFVTRAGAYAELPGSVCVQIEPDAHEKRLLVEYLNYFAAHPAAAAALGARARAHVAANHTLARAAQGYNDFLTRVISQ